MHQWAAWTVAAVLVTVVGVGGSDASQVGLTQTIMFAVQVPPVVRWVGQSRDGSATLGLDYDPTRPEQNVASATLRLATNVDVTIEAQVSPFTSLVDSSDLLTTTWRIEDDREGDSQKSGIVEDDAHASRGCGAFVPGGAFLSGGLHVAHCSGDGNVRLTVAARAQNDGARAKSPGRYEAMVVLTALPHVPAFGAQGVGRTRGARRAD